LLTGRSTEYAEVLKALTSHVGVTFDEVGLKPTREDEVVKTMDFKLQFIISLIEKYAPVRKV